MIHIPFTGAAILSSSELQGVSDSFTSGAQALAMFLAEQQQYLVIIRQQAGALTTLMAIQNAMADTINAAEEDVTVEELRKRLVAVIGEQSA